MSKKVFDSDRVYDVRQELEKLVVKLDTAKAAVLMAFEDKAMRVVKKLSNSELAYIMDSYGPPSREDPEPGLQLVLYNEALRRLDNPGDR